MAVVLALPIFKQGDDLDALKAEGKSAEDVLRAYADQLTDAAARVKKVADIIHDTPTTVEGNTHCILLDNVPDVEFKLLKHHSLVTDD